MCNKTLQVAIFTFFILLYVTLPAGTYAKAPPVAVKPVLGVSPVIFNISLQPGKTYIYNVEVVNLTDSPVPVQAMMDTLETTDEDDAFKSPQEASPLLSWVTLDTKDMIIPPKGKKAITVTIKIPNVIPVGGYYGILFFQPQFPALKDSDTIISAKIGVPFLASVGVAPEMSQPAEIIDFSFDNVVYENGPVVGSLRVKNTALSHFTAKPVLKVRSLFGKKKTILLEEKIVFPGKGRKWQTSFELPTYVDIYTISAVVSTGNGNQIEQETYIVAFPWKLLALVMLIGLGITVAIRNNKRIIEALLILIGKK